MIKCSGCGHESEKCTDDHVFETYAPFRAFCGWWCRHHYYGWDEGVGQYD